MSDVFHLGLTRDQLEGETLAVLPGDPGNQCFLSHVQFQGVQGFRLPAWGFPTRPVKSARPV